MTPRVSRWLLFSVVLSAIACWSAPAASAAGLGDQVARWTERIGARVEQAPDPIAGLTDAQLAGQRIVVGFDGRSAPEAILRRAAAGELGGVILFARNIGSRDQVRALVGRLQATADRAPGGRRLLVMVDQEGGQVSRLPGPPRRSPAEVGRTASIAVARGEGRATGRSLAGVGINVDLAPVVDVARPGTNMAKLERSYGPRRGVVTRMATAFAAGLRASGVLSCAKHFPGLGLARGDEDLRLNRIDLPLSRLRAVDEPPFTAAGTELVMVSTGIYPALDDAPALFSPRIVTGELRDHLVFQGTTLTDDLEVPAIASSGTPATRALRAARAGNDLLLFAQSTDAGLAAAQGLQAALADGSLDRAQFEAATRRTLDLRSRVR
jgi:beta-N-acetylhexosaminidase